MHLRALIQGGRSPGELRTPATLATLATVGAGSPQFRPTVATVATVAALGPLDGWPDRLRSLPLVQGMRWDLAAAALEGLLRAGVVEKALALGWDARELIGVQRRQPHGAPHCAGLIWSMRAGDTVPDMRLTGCIIAYGNVRHIWKRVPLPVDGSVCLPWELR